jgi:hypothetical protein
LEQDIQTLIRTTLRVWEPRFILVQRTNSGEAYTRGGGKIELCLPGTPDLTIFIKGGRTAHVEVKRPGEVQRPTQRQMSEWLEALGHEYHVVQSVGDVLDLVEVWQEAWSGDKTAPRIS